MSIFPKFFFTLFGNAPLPFWLRSYIARVEEDGGTIVDTGHTKEVYADVIDYEPTLIQSCDSGKAGTLYSIIPSRDLLLYQYTGAAAAYSLRSLSAGTIYVVKVRRSGDDAELDFTAEEVSDGTLAAWVVAGGGTEDGFVTTWYDQSGNTNNATQATAANQPKIVSSGTLVTENGKAALDFDGTDDYLSVNTGFSQPVFVSLVVKNIKSSASFPYYLDSNSTGRFLLYVEDASGITASAAYSTLLRLNSNVIKTVQSLISCLYNTTSSFIAIDGQEVVSGAIDTNNINSPLYIGSRNTLAQFMQGTFQEIIIYPSDESANRTGIEANINAHYNIYP